jgi:HTH-type transcriptional regulator/antitoxin HigA
MLAKPTKKTKPHDSYLELVLRFPLASIRDDDHLAEAQSVIDEVSANPELDAGQTMYLDALCDLVACYEDEHYSIEPASDADMLKHLLEAKGVTQQQVSQATGIPKSSISEVLSGKKQITKQMIRKLAEYFQIDASVLTSNW